MFCPQRRHRLSSRNLLDGRCLQARGIQLNIKMARGRILLGSGLSALSLSVATATLMYILAVSLHHAQRHPVVLFLSAVVQTISCLASASTLWRLYRSATTSNPEKLQETRHRTFPCHFIVSTAISVIAAIIAGTALGWIEGNTPANYIQVGDRPASLWLAVTFAIWGCFLAAQAVHIAAATRECKASVYPAKQRPGLEESRPPMTANTQHSITYPDTVASSPPTLVPSEGPSSFRSSFSTLRQPGSRPSSSKKNLLVRQYSYPRNSQRSSFETVSRRPSQDEGFDSWDTSQVSLQIRETILQSKPTIMKKQPALATIPGSRSPSPAKALEGPFFNPSPSESPPSSPLPQPSVSRPNSPPSSPTWVLNLTNVFPPTTLTSPPGSPPLGSTPSLPKLQTSISAGTGGNINSPISSPVLPIMRHGSLSGSPNSMSEDHIHPLFRTTSLSPAPSPSLGTVVTAAPEAGSSINERELRRMRSGSLPSPPNSLIRLESSPDVWTRSRSIAVTQTDAPPIPRRSLSRPSPRPLHLRKRSVSYEDNMNRIAEV